MTEKIARIDDIKARFAHYRQRFVEAFKARGYTNEGFAERIGAHPVTVSKLRSGKTRLDDEWRAAVALGLGIREETLFGTGPLPAPVEADKFVSPKKAASRALRARKTANDNLGTIPHFGLAAGSLAGAHSVSSDLPDEVPCPPGLRDVVGAYALTTRGESMIPRYFPGERLYVNPNQAVRPGDHVVIQTTTADNKTLETFVKRYDGEAAGVVRVSQYNPRAQIEFRRPYVGYVHRIVPLHELF